MSLIFSLCARSAPKVRMVTVFFNVIKTESFFSLWKGVSPVSLCFTSFILSSFFTVLRCLLLPLGLMVSFVCVRCCPILWSQTNDLVFTVTNWTHAKTNAAASRKNPQSFALRSPTAVLWWASSLPVCPGPSRDQFSLLTPGPATCCSGQQAFLVYDAA